jgi:hypothetical protein
MTIVLVAEFYLVLRDVQQTIVRDRHGEKIASGLVESAINQVVSKRMVKKQQMGWSQRWGAPFAADTDPGA